jgi:hypothetical protein
VAEEEVEMRRALLVGMGAVLAVVLLAGPAAATYTKFIEFDLSHVNQGDDLSLRAKLVLDGSRNPPTIPPGGRDCKKEALVKAQRKNANGDWVNKGNGVTDNQGNIKIVVDDQQGRWRLVKPRHLTEDPVKDCFKAVSRSKRHRHGSG